MEKSGAGRVHSGQVVLDIGDGVGALILYTKPELEGQEIEVSMGVDSPRVHTEVLERRINGESVFAAVYASLAEGHYRIWGSEPKTQSEVDIVGGQVSEVDWR